MNAAGLTIGGTLVIPTGATTGYVLTSDTSGNCSWGPPGSGPQGNQGVAGTTGSNGTQGNQGNQGVAGTNGSNGTQGNQGVAGTSGTQGNQGVAGTSGTQGNQGVAGTSGTQGNQGVAGTSGTQGNQGNQGRQGFQGIAGTGTQGPQGSGGGGGGTPGGSSGQLQYNSSGSFAGAAGLTTDGTNLTTNKMVFSTDTNDNSFITSGTQIKIGQTGDLYGASSLTILNTTGSNGAIFSCDTLAVVDFIISAAGTQRNIRLETRGTGTTYAGGGSPEFQFGVPTSPSICINDNYAFSRVPFKAQNNFTTSQATLIAQTYSGQSLDLVQYQNSSGTTLSGVDCNGYVRMVTGSGAPTSTPSDGALYVDTTNNYLYVRTGGAWKKTTLS